MASPAQVHEGNYLTDKTGVMSWLLTTDHKRIAWLYLAAITAFFVVGGLAAVMIRLELLTPRGDLVNTDTYNKMFSCAWDHHGLVLPDPLDSNHPRELPHTPDDRRERSCISQTKPCQLVHLRRWRYVHFVGNSSKSP